MRRDKKNAILGGVCAGISNYLSIPVVIVRLLFLFAIFWVGGGLLAYLLLWILMPAEDNVSLLGNLRLERDEKNGLIGGVCAGLSLSFEINVIILRLLWAAAVFYFGFGLIPYLILWVLMPKKES